MELLQSTGELESQRRWYCLFFPTISFRITSHVRGTEITSRFGGFTYRITGEGMTRPPETVVFPPACQQAAV